MAGRRVGGVPGHGFDEGVGVEHVVAHGGQHLVGRVRQAHRVGGLLQELPDARGVLRVDVDDAELAGERDRLADRRDRGARPRVDVRLDHLGEVHAVHVVGTDDDDDVGPLVLDDVEALVDGVGAAQVPVLADPLLCGHGDTKLPSSEDMRHVWAMCLSRECDLYWVSTTTCRNPELMTLDRAKSIRR